MEFDVQTIAPCRKKIAVKIPADEVQGAYDKKFEEINEQVALPGFRPGRAPRPLLEKRFGGKLGDDVKQDLLKEMLSELLEKEKLEPLATPEIDVEAIEINPESAIEFAFEVVTKPEFETPTYKGLEVGVPPVEVSAEEIQQGVDTLRQHVSRLEPVEGASVEDGDVLVLDWRAMEGDSVEARDDGVYYPYGRGVVAGFVAEGLDAQLAGQAVGAQATAKVTAAADDPREDLRGRELDLEVTLTEIRRYVLPEIDEAFLEQHDYDDEDELREDVEKRIRRSKLRARDREAEEQLVAGLVEGIDISLPEEFVEQELEGWASRKRMQLEMDETDEGDIARRIDADRADTKAAIEGDMRKFFLLDRIAKEEALEATETEMVQALEEIASAYGRPVEEVFSSFRDGGRLDHLRTEIRHRKARELIRREATLVEDAALAEKTTEKKATKKKAAKKKGD